MVNLKEKRSVETMLMAATRTELANRRTILAYIRTSTGLGIASAGLIHLVQDSPISTKIGYGLLPVVVIVLIIGIYDYFYSKRIIDKERKDAGC